MQNKLMRFYRVPLLLLDFLFTELPVLAQNSPKIDEQPSSPWTTSNWFWLGGAVLVTFTFARLTRPKKQNAKPSTGAKTAHFPGRVKKMTGHKKSHQL
jgi:hypothetical protein